MFSKLSPVTTPIWVASIFVFLTPAFLALAQQPTATVLGTVKDSSGAVVPLAAVTAQNRETGLRREAVTAADGSYRFAALPVGTYEIRVEHAGFQSEVRGPITFTVGQEAVLNFTLQVGAVEQTISVMATAPLVSTTSGSLGGLVSQENVANLPLNGRNYINLTLLQPGVAQQKNLGRSTNSIGTWFSTNGAPPRSNYYTLDGAAMSDHSGATTSSVSGNTLGIEGIREWRMITSSFSAEYGMTMGSQMVMVSKSGTNEFHGSLFEYLRNSALDARNFFDRITPATPRRLPAFTRNNFGGSVGGPIRKDKAFFFATYEGLRERLGVTTISNTIPASARVDGGAGGVAQIADVVKPLLALYPLPNLGTNQFTFPFSQPTTDNFGQARVDLTFSDKDTMFVRSTVEEGQETDSFAFPPFVLNREGRVQFHTLSESHVFTPTLLNTARFSFTRTRKATTTPSGIIGPQYSFVPGQEIGIIGIGGVSSFGGDGPSPYLGIQNLFNWSDDLFYSKGRHSLKFGTLINRYQQFLWQSQFGRGQVSFANIASFLQARPSSLTALSPDSITDRTYHYTSLGFYGQDDVRVTSRLTLNLGLRYEFLTQPREVTGHQSNLRDVQHDATMTVGPFPFKNPSLKNFSPRFGFAWDVRGDGKTAVRGGFGLLYDISTLGSFLLIGTVGNPPFAARSSLTLPPTSTYTITLPFSFPPEVSGKALRLIDYSIQQPHLLQYNLTVERQLPFSTALRLSYVGSRGINLIQNKEGNPVVPEIQTDGRYFFPPNAPRVNRNFDTMTWATAGGNSWYNSLQFGLIKSLSRGLQFQSSYTWSRCIDETQGQFGLESTADALIGHDAFNRKTNRGLCIFDLTQNWQFNSLYHLPQVTAVGGPVSTLLNGWWIGAIVAAQSGLPFTPALSANRSRSLQGSDHPDLVPGRTWKDIVSGQSVGCLGVLAGTKLGGPDLYFDPCAFAIPAAGFLGNAGRTILRGPGVFTLDFTLAKDTPVKYLGENGKLEFRAEFFNLLNRANFAAPNQTNINTAALVFAGTADVQAPLATAGKITSTSTSSRQIQLALKILF